jgi:hypothetical protein
MTRHLCTLTYSVPFYYISHYPLQFLSIVNRRNGIYSIVTRMLDLIGQLLVLLHIEHCVDNKGGYFYT